MFDLSESQFPTMEIGAASRNCHMDELIRWDTCLSQCLMPNGCCKTGSYAVGGVPITITLSLYMTFWGIGGHLRFQPLWWTGSGYHALPTKAG